ncbi:glycosyl hydrolase family 18 protein [Nocardioides dongxiaopingii]|uniref:glycosyl hydrolase family 18 protein n=1 Tax=Nocardioides dongxiaopingii TaxID=2576036 RepID=UPI0010C76D9A|nr:glycosyl hydrolase family 18 protein [Nocardioides dongxiaopingii]
MTGRRPTALALGTLPLLLALVLALVLAPPASARAEEPEVTGYALGSLAARVLARDAGALTTVTVAAAPLSADGRRALRPAADVLRVGRVARRQGLRTELLLSNYSNRLGAFDPRAAHRLLSDPRSVRRVARQLARHVADGRWDGVNVDLELVRRGDAGGLVALVEALQDAMPAERTVTIDISASTSLRSYRDRGYALARIGRAVDAVQLMAYDQHGPTWSGPGPVGDLRWQRAAVETVLRRVPASRLDLGVAGYGYTWPPASSGRTGRTVTPARARLLVERAGVRAVWHARSGEWSARLPNGTALWWSDARSYDRRVDLAEELGLRGLAVWRLGSADPLPR